MTRSTSTLALGLGLALASALPACGPSKEARATCKAAAERYSTCTREIMGAEMEKLARGKEDIDGCAKSTKTVELYASCCLPKKTCSEFMDCTMDIAMGKESCAAPAR